MNSWEFIDRCHIWGDHWERNRSNDGIIRIGIRVCFVLWRSPRNEMETPQIVAGFNLT